MISVWLPGLPSLLVALLLIFVPGSGLALLAGIRGMRLVLASAPLSVFVVATGAVVTEPFLPWGWLAFGLWWSVVAVCAAVLGRINRPQRDAPINQRRLLLVGCALVVAAAGSFWGIARGMESAATPSLAWDAAFHLSAVREIYQNGSGSLFSLGQFANGAFYPSGWHDLTALVLPISGNAVVAANMVSVAVISFLWPVSVTALTATVLPSLRYAPLFAALFAAGTVAFPTLTSSYGTLWPMTLGYALVPMLLALLVIALRGNPLKPSWSTCLLLAAGLVGMVLVHPQAGLAFAVLALWPVLGAAWRILRRTITATSRGVVFVCTIILTYVVVVGALVALVDAGGLAAWEARERNATLWREFLGAFADSQLRLFGYGNGNPNMVLGLSFLLGAAWLIWKKKARWLLAAWAGATYLHLVAATGQLPGGSLLAYWYYDAPRLGAIIIVPLVVVASIGAGVITSWLLAATAKYVSPRPWVNGGVVIALVVVTFVGTQFFMRDARATAFGHNYHFSGSSSLNGLASPEQMRMIAESGELLSDDARILGESMNGTPLFFAVTGREVVYKYHGDSGGDAGVFLRQHFSELLDNPQVCAVLNQEGIHYYYQDSIRYVLNEEDRTPPSGLFLPEETLSALDPIAHSDTGTLYRITPCD